MKLFADINYMKNNPLYELINYTIKSNSYGIIHPTLAYFYMYFNPGNLVYECLEWDGVEDTTLDKLRVFKFNEEEQIVIRIWRYNRELEVFQMLDPNTFLTSNSVAIENNWSIPEQFEKIEIYSTIFIENPLKKYQKGQTAE